MYSLAKCKERIRPNIPSPKIKEKEEKLILKMTQSENVLTVDEVMKILRCSKHKADMVIKEAKKKRKEILSVVRSQTDMQAFTPKGFQNPKESGFIYLVENEAFPGWVKCGMTTNVISRLSSYNSSDPLKRFVLISSKTVAQRRKAEKLLLDNMVTRSKIRNGEWFRIEKDEAILVFNNLTC